MVSLGLGLVLAPLPAIATPVLEVDSSGILTGVNDVLVDGSYYDVRFADGTCTSVYGVCDAAHFAFGTSASAVDASLALLSALDAPSDFDETKIYGCGSPGGCVMLTPFGTIPGYTSLALLYDNTPVNTLFPDRVIAPFQFGVDGDTGPLLALTWAVWTPTASVFEPSAVTMLGVGLLALIFIRRRRKAHLNAL